MSEQVNDWDDTAQHYSDNITRFTSLHATDLIGALYNDIKSAKTILDIGCGPGAFGVAYLNFFPNGIDGQTIIFSDLSQGMVNKARDVMQQRVPSDFKTELKYQVEDGSLLEGIEDDSIDVVVSIFGVFIIPDRAKTLKTIQRVLRKPNGVFGTASWASIECQELLKGEGFGAGFHNSTEQALKSLTNLFSEKEAPWKQWFDVKRIHEMVVDGAGFGSVKVHRSVHSVTWSSPMTLWEMIKGSPTSKVKTADPDVAEAAKQSLFAKVRSGDEDEDSPVFVWTASNLTIARGLASE